MKNVLDSRELARKIRRHVIEMAHASRSSHVGSALSIADIVAVLYARFVDPIELERRDRNRTRIVLSKGHAGSAIYAALAEIGLLPIDELKTHYADGSRLSGHVSHKGLIGVEVSTGSLGTGIGMATGMALVGARDGLSYRTFAIVGDGECDEGSVWEAALFARQQRLKNLTVIVDRNRLQGLGSDAEILDLLDLGKKFDAFGWNVFDVDGHDHEQLLDALSKRDDSRPTAVIAHTIKGKGVSFMENNNLWHYRDPQGADYDNAVRELEANRQ